ncbi:amidohydrolase family protein [Clostridium felsineum]|uniref:amidohydrolase family protein n=1 Tax=Clostridium felsineum TaxID=36839 RepID=UPI00214DBC66|nr:amidohydrolase family protein [Clostridium felsineum]
MNLEFRKEYVKDYVGTYGEKIMSGKISLEDHYESPDWEATGDPQYETARDKKKYFQVVKTKLHSAEERIKDMNRNGVEMSIMSLTQPGVQEVLDTKEAIKIAHEMNIWVYENYVKKYPKRFNAFAAVAMQEPEEAAKELEFCVKELGFVGALINGYTMKGNKDHIEYLDEPQNFCFWKKMTELDVPLYLHPRDPAPSQQIGYKGYNGLSGSAWGFGAETALHTIRLLCSGLFDELPSTKLIIGHLGENLTQGLTRMQRRFDDQVPCGNHKKPVTEYFENNVWVTTSGHFDTHALLNAILTCDSKKIMFSADTPYESLDEAAIWFDNLPISYAEKVKMGRQNAVDLLKLNI